MKTSFKHSIHALFYTPILTRLDMLDPDATTGLGTLGPPDNIKKLQVETRTYGENIKHKHKIQTPNNTNITLDYMEYLETKYSWSDYVTREDLPRILEDKFSCFF